MQPGARIAFITSILMAQDELVYSLLTAVLVIIISLPLALAAAQELKRPGFRGAAAWIIVLVPLAIPAPLIGIGMITIGNLPVLSAVYPALIMPALVSVVKFAPFAAIVLFIQMRFIDPLLFDAAAIFARKAERMHGSASTFLSLPPGWWCRQASLQHSRSRNWVQR